MWLRLLLLCGRVDMNIRTMFERVTRYAKIPVAAFLDYYNDAASAILSAYGNRHVLMPGAKYRDILSLDDSPCVRSEYDAAMMDKILYMATGNADRLVMYREDAEMAYRNVFRLLARGKVANIRATNDPYSQRAVRMRRGEENV